MSKFGRYQVAEPPSSLELLHLYTGAPLQEVDHEPKVGVLDQEDLNRQGIYCSNIIPGAQDVDSLGSCTANANVSALSNILDQPTFEKFVYGNTSFARVASVYEDVRSCEIAAIKFYHACTDQTGDTATEWPPTDCGSSGVYVVQENEHQGLCSGQRLAHGAENLVSLMQADGVLMGSPWLNAWMTPDANAFIDGDGTTATLEAQIKQGVAGGHETYLCAVEKITLTPTGRIVPQQTIIRARNSWTKSWGDNGCYRVHLSTLEAISSHSDYRQLVK